MIRTGHTRTDKQNKIDHGALLTVKASITSCAHTGDEEQLLGSHWPRSGSARSDDSNHVLTSL